MKFRTRQVAIIAWDQCRQKKLDKLSLLDTRDSTDDSARLEGVTKYALPCVCASVMRNPVDKFRRGAAKRVGIHKMHMRSEHVSRRMKQQSRKKPCYKATHRKSVDASAIECVSPCPCENMVLVLMASWRFSISWLRDSCPSHLFSFIKPKFRF